MKERFVLTKKVSPLFVEFGFQILILGSIIPCKDFGIKVS